MALKYICAGLSRTGTTSFHRAMLLLGYKSKHYDTIRLWDVVCGLNSAPNFKIYDDFDAISDLPAPIYLKELLEAYPDAKVILTVRDTENWWKSIHHRFSKKKTKDASLLGRIALRLGFKWWPRCRFDRTRMFKAATRRLAYGSVNPEESEYKRRYEAFNAKVISSIPKEKLLIMNICEGEGWEKLCRFIGCDIPEDPFPCAKAH